MCTTVLSACLSVLPALWWEEASDPPGLELQMIVSYDMGDENST